MSSDLTTQQPQLPPELLVLETCQHRWGDWTGDLWTSGATKVRRKRSCAVCRTVESVVFDGPKHVVYRKLVVVTEVPET